MSFEVEVKYREVDHDGLRRLLAEVGAVEVGAMDQEDLYLSHPSRDFAQTNEALRLRRIGGENRITYKGPKLPGPTKTREEIEIPFLEGEDAFRQLSRLFENLGFVPVAAVRKHRTAFHLTVAPYEIEVTLDRVEGLGDFAEIEAIAPDAAALPATQEAVMAAVGLFGLDRIEPRSYLRMILEARAGGSVGGLESG